MRFYQFITAACLSTCALGVLAQSDERHDEDSEGYALGILVGNDQSLYVGGDDEIQPFPFIQARWGNFFIGGPGIGYYLYEDNGWSISTSIALDGIGDTDRDNSKLLADMPEFDSIVMGQVGISKETNWGEFSLSLASDVSGTHDGTSAELEYSFEIPMAGWMIEPSIGLQWQSEEINQYFYGVEQQYVRPDRAFYKADAGVNYSAGIMAMYPFMENHAVVLNLEYESYSKEISDSSIVDRDNTFNVGIGYVYRF